MIHHFDGSHWLPGPTHRDGSRPFPDRPKAGTFFNDVTGAIGATAQAVEESLLHLQMKQSALADILPSPCNLLALFEGIVRGQPPESEGPPSRLITEVLLGPDESLQVRPVGAWSLTISQELARFALALVRANGQMAYIRRQPWFKAGHHQVVLLVESEFDRTLNFLSWHKDTGGDALFSNLVFRNRPGMLATEWTPDLQPMPPEKRELLEKSWPPALLGEIDAARRQLAQLDEHELSIEGGTLDTDGVIGWVDELAWHSSPMLAHRLRWSAERVAAVMDEVQFDLDTYDLMMQIAQRPGTRFAQWLVAHDRALETLSGQVAEGLWTDAHTQPGGRPILDALRRDVEDIDWSEVPADANPGISLIQNLPDGEGQRIMTQPTGIAGRPRSNSAEMDELASRPAAHQIRNFIQVIVAIRPRQ